MTESTPLIDDRPTRTMAEKMIPAILMLVLLLLFFRPLFAWDLHLMSEARHMSEFTETMGPLPQMAPGQKMFSEARTNFAWDVLTFLIIAAVVVTVSAGRMRMIVYNTFREAVRNRILYFIVLFAIILMAASMIIKDLAVEEHGRIVINLGMASINFFGLLVAVFVGISLVYNELERRTIYTLVSKPIHRYQYLLGKYFGLLLTIFIILGVMTWFFFSLLNYQYLMVEAGNGGIGLFFMTLVKAVFCGFLNILGFTSDSGLFESLGLATDAVTGRFLVATGFACLELMIITSFAILFSSFTTPTLSAVFTILIFIAGRLNADLVVLADRIARQALTENGLKYISELPAATIIKLYTLKFVSWVLPNLGDLTINEQLLHRDVVNAWRYPAVYAILYSGAILCVSILIFRRRNFK